MTGFTKAPGRAFSAARHFTCAHWAALALALVAILANQDACHANPPAQSQATVIHYLTDLEGDLAKWQEYVQRSGAFARDENGELYVVPGVQFVFGGDATDQHGGDLRILQDLVRLAERQPDSVTLLMGNRDLNKMIFREINPRSAESDVPQILAQMNARFAFAHFKNELSQLGLQSDDAAAAQAYIALVNYDGWITRYLRQAKLARVIGSTLFVHGWWAPQIYIPGGPRGRRVEDQVKALNAFAQEQVDLWLTGTSADQLPLFAYQSDHRGVVYGSYSDANWNPTPPNPQFAQELLDQGIHRVVVGHRSYGSFPLVMRQGNFEVLLMDNSPASGPRTGVSILKIDGLQTNLSNRRIQSANGLIENITVSYALDKPPTITGHKLPDHVFLKADLGAGKVLAYRQDQPGRWKDFVLEGPVALPSHSNGDPCVRRLVRGLPNYLKFWR